jgi:Zn-dependent M28 family amino/carboxypeptidase
MFLKEIIMRHKFLSLLLIVVLFVSASAQQAKRAVDSAPSVENLRAHVTYLASDKLQGRRTGTDGTNEAAEYIAKTFKKLKLNPPSANNRGTVDSSGKQSRDGLTLSFGNNPLPYLQSFPYIAEIVLGKSNALSISNTQLQTAQDWMPLGFSSNSKVSKASAIFVGYGISDSSLKYDDYNGLDVKGKVVIALAKTPDGDNQRGQFARYNDARFKAVIAKEKGAAALFLIANEEKFSDDKLSSMKNDYSPNDSGLPVVAISRQAAAQMFGMQTSNLPSLETGWQERKGLQAKRLEDVTINLETELVRKNAPAYNVIGILEGSDPQLKKEAIVIGAHYDHLGLGGAGSLAEKPGAIHYGADDNASGTAGLLELARIFSTNRKQIRRTIIFIAFSGEEEGLVGSNFYVNHPVFPLQQTVAMINMDMIGRLKDNKLTIGGIGTASEWKDLVNAKNFVERSIATTANGREIAAPTTLTPIFNLQLNEDGFGPSDHSSFYGKQIPVLFFFTGTHEDYHKPTDTADKINYDGQAQILNMVADIVKAIDANDKRPTYTVAKSSNTGGRTGFNVTLGVVPSYAESTDGMLLDGVLADKPAEKAGLKAGDKVVKLAGREIKNVYDYTQALSEMKAGIEYEVEVIRDGQRLTFKITPAVRK